MFVPYTFALAAKNILSAYTALLLAAGDDIDPKHYGTAGAAGANYDAARDTLELKMIALAEQWNLPILGICRGSQLINVSRNGNLIGDLRPLRRKTPNRNSMRPIKYANILSGSPIGGCVAHSPTKDKQLAQPCGGYRGRQPNGCCA